jgi:hypothetical protein
MTNHTKDTYVAIAQVKANEGFDSGRFQKLNIVSTVPEYPRLPESSPWSTPCPAGPEPAIGININETPDLGFGQRSDFAAPTATPSAVETEFDPQGARTSSSPSSRPSSPDQVRSAEENGEGN